MNTVMDNGLREQAQQIKLVIFDVDGVLTDGRLFFGDDGQEYKAFHSRDGLGMKMLMRSGVEVAVITARSSQVVAHRMKNLGVHRFYQGQANKVPVFQGIAEEMGLDYSEIAYVGDDIIDLPVMVQVGLAIAVSDAHPEVRSRAHWTTSQVGGRGAAREACEMIMEAQQTLKPYIEGHLNGLTN